MLPPAGRVDWGSAAREQQLQLSLLRQFHGLLPQPGCLPKTVLASEKCVGAPGYAVPACPPHAQHTQQQTEHTESISTPAARSTQQCT